MYRIGCRIMYRVGCRIMYRIGFRMGFLRRLGEGTISSSEKGRGFRGVGTQRRFP